MPSRTQRLVIVGAGALGREIVDLIEAINLRSQATDRPVFEVLGFLDDTDPDESLIRTYGLWVIGTSDSLAGLPDDVGYVVAIGDSRARRTIDQRLALQNRDCPVLVHPTVTLGRSVVMGPGTIICSHASLTNHITLGRHVHVNLNCTIGHDSVMSDYVTLSPLVSISGGVKAENGAFFGAGSVVNPRLTVGKDAIVGAGAAVVRDVKAGITAVGVPAKPLGRD